MERKQFPLGSDLKFKVDITELGDDVVLDDVPYSIKFSCGGKDKTYTVTVSNGTQTRPTGVSRVNDHQVIAACPTGDLARGNLYLTIAAEVTDTDFSDGTRHEEKTIDLGVNII